EVVCHRFPAVIAEGDLEPLRALIGAVGAIDPIRQPQQPIAIDGAGEIGPFAGAELIRRAPIRKTEPLVKLSLLDVLRAGAVDVEPVEAVADAQTESGACANGAHRCARRRRRSIALPAGAHA